MKCYKCGNEIGDGFEYCPICTAPIVLNSPAANKVLTVLKDRLFLAVCILLSVSCGATVLSGNGIPITALLAMIFLWITYSRSKNGIVDVKNMRCVSGVVYAEYVITNVVAIILAVAGILLGVAVSLVGTSTELMQSYMQGFTVSGLPFDIDITDAFALGMGWVVAGLFIFISAIMLVINIFAWKKLHAFVKSVYVGVQNGGATPIVNARIAKTWLWVFGIFSVLSTLGSLPDVFALVANGCSAAAYIIGAVLVDRYFVSNKTVEEIEQVSQYGEN